MTFTALSPWLAWLLVAAAAAIAAAVFAIRPRPPRRVVSSLIIWQRVLDDTRKRSLWERVRWVVSLIVTAVIAAAIAGALGKPEPGGVASGPGRLLIVIDSSWSMRAERPSGGTRWERAIQGAWVLATTSGGREVALATTAEGLVEGPTADRALIRSALDRLTPSGGADEAWARVADAGEVHFFTDGAVARPAIPDVVVHSVFVPAPNVAVTAFDVQSAPETVSGAEAFMVIANHAPTSQTVQVTVTRAADVVFTRSLELRPGEDRREIVPLPLTGDPRFHVHVSATENALAIDDDAGAWLATAQPLRVAVVARTSGVAAMLAKDRALQVFVVEPGRFREARADVWVFDGWLPLEAPTGPALVIDPPASPWLGARGTEEAGPAWRVKSQHQILDGVDATLVRIEKGAGVLRPSLESVVISARNTPLVSIEDTAAGRFVVLGFSVADSNVALTSAYPILVGNAIDWLGRPERGLHRQPGPIALPASTSRVIAPTGQSLPLAKVDDRVTARLPEPGLYLVESTGAPRVVSVGLGDPLRSNLLASSIAPDLLPQSGSLVTSRPWWIVAALAALVLVTIEWVTWQRRITV